MVKSSSTLTHRLNRQPLAPPEREALLTPYLPPPSPTLPRKRRPIRSFLNNQLHILLYTLIHLLFSLYIRIRQAYHAVIDRVFAVLYYHHRTPELIKKDVKGLGRLPEHLSVVLQLENEAGGGAGLDGLVDEVAEVAAWCASAGIGMLSVYEKTGILKSHIHTTQRTISTKLHAYFGRPRPPFELLAPRLPPLPLSSPSSTPALQILLLSAEDGRESLVDLTRTLAEMAQRGKISPADISVELVDAEVSESVMGEPELLVLFGPVVKLDGYPPWQVRLTEIL
ncbi:hypothetical protein FGG08_007098 [Glutinoglossum americanum]|uniref:ditrans,polycis-polyprenyl diphosphate synthase [(2E,6E)-farnesyldiphosphate specific] n=1 Tax=Glutinoglossum americanum TaxID=1670608 RepID=A0A9P8KZQ3_9PEZI|nr:hypothetical protein FGG08_007098 [Glutinoglossum americanum]